LNSQLQGQRLLQAEQGREKLTQERRALGRRQVCRRHGGTGGTGDTRDTGNVSGISDVSGISGISDISDVSDVSGISGISDCGDVSEISNIRIDWRAFVGRKHGQRLIVLRSRGLRVGHRWAAEQGVLVGGFGR